MSEYEIEQVSDTALWISGFRAIESDRPDRAFFDPFAKTLAGERGLAMAHNLKAKEAMGFAMTVRTIAIDNLILEALAEETYDVVINFGAGLDTRPYRLDLPPGLLWIEVDFPHVLAYKQRLLEHHQPRCRLESIACNLIDEVERRSLFDRLNARTHKALVITEGVLFYFSPEARRSFCGDLYNSKFADAWILDYAKGHLKKINDWRVKKALKRIPLQPDSSDPIAFLQAYGWKISAQKNMLDEADKINRPLPLFFPWSILIKIAPQTIRRLANQTYGYVRLKKS